MEMYEVEHGWFFRSRHLCTMMSWLSSSSRGALAMHNPNRLAAEHTAVSRRYFLQLGAAGIAALQFTPWLAQSDVAQADDPAERATLEAELAKLEYLTKWDDFRLIERGEPLPYTHPIEKLREVGLT